MQVPNRKLLNLVFDFLLCGVSSPRDEFLVFRQKEPKPCLPVRGPSEPAQKQALRDASASTPNKMAQKLATLKQSSPRGRFGTPALPRPTQVNSRSQKTKPRPRWCGTSQFVDMILKHGPLESTPKGRGL